jgi:serine/threonine protein kinase
MERDEAEARIGTTLKGKWTLERLLGVGGMAAAYVGVHRIGRREAIKVLHREIAKEPSIRARFEREARAANLVEHPAIVPIRDVDVTDDGMPFLVMDLVAGESLADRLAAKTRLLPDEVLGFMEELCDALAAAHAHGVVHRDIKPENLLVQPDGRLRVLDFGIARIHAADPSGFRTKSGVTLGTASYMPPEQIRGGEVDGRTDVFAVGATMFRLLSGRHVHNAVGSEGDLLVRMATEQAPPLASVAPDLPAGLCRVVDRALALDPRRRYPDAASMRGDLRAVRRGEAPPWACGGGRADETVAEGVRPAWADDTHAAPPEHEDAPTDGGADLVSSVRPRLPEELDRMLGRSRIRTVSASAKRWAPTMRIVHGVLAVLAGAFGVFLWLALYSAKAAFTIRLLLWMLATAPLALAALLGWRALAAHRRMNLPTDEAIDAVLRSLRASGGRVAAAEVAAHGELSVDHVSEALAALTKSGSCRPLQTRDGFLVYEFALETSAGATPQRRSSGPAG